MHGEHPLSELKGAYLTFCSCVLSVPETLFLTSMNGWSPRDVVAHLIGWNRQMVAASQQVLRGETPQYYADAPYDYQHINAGFVARFASQSKAELLSELNASLQAFEQYIFSLDENELSASHGVVHYCGRQATLAGIIASLTGDYQHHQEQISEWLHSQIPPSYKPGEGRTGVTLI